MKNYIRFKVKGKAALYKEVSFYEGNLYTMQFYYGLFRVWFSSIYQCPSIVCFYNSRLLFQLSPNYTLLEGKYQRKIARKHKASINCTNFWIVFIKNISYDTTRSSKMYTEGAK